MRKVKNNRVKKIITQELKRQEARGDIVAVGMLKHMNKKYQ